MSITNSFHSLNSQLLFGSFPWPTSTGGTVGMSRKAAGSSGYSLQGSYSIGKPLSLTACLEKSLICIKP